MSEAARSATITSWPDRDARAPAMPRPPVTRSRSAVWATLLLASLLVAGTHGPAAADCVASFSQCATACDQRTREGDPRRPQCARGCITSFDQCERIVRFQSLTGGAVQGGVLAPGQ